MRGKKKCREWRAARPNSPCLADDDVRRPLDDEDVALFIAQHERRGVAQHLVTLLALHDEGLGAPHSCFYLDVFAFPPLPVDSAPVRRARVVRCERADGRVRRPTREAPCDDHELEKVVGYTSSVYSFTSAYLPSVACDL